MKLPVLTFLVLTTFVRAQPIPDAELDKISREDISATLRHLQAIAKEAGQRADEAEQHEAKVIGALQVATRENTGLLTALQTAERTAKALEAHDAQATAYADAEHERANRLAVDAEKQRALAWKWRLIAGGIALAAVLFLEFRESLRRIPVVGRFL